jgi:hypothetical protein
MWSHKPVNLWTLTNGSLWVVFWRQCITELVTVLRYYEALNNSKKQGAGRLVNISPRSGRCEHILTAPCQGETLLTRKGCIKSL